jgi:FkbM family methyltransferase
MTSTLSYAQRYEDLHLLRCFGAQRSGFYIDIGAGHPVYDNVSFAFYLRGWSGITVEPNPWLADLSAAVRPRDWRIESLVGAKRGESTYYLVEDFHGFSTTVESNAQAVLQNYGKAARAMAVPVTTLTALCELYASKQIDFLKIDVEGAEKDVLMGGDWDRFRPKVIVLEALAPVTLMPAWADWEPLLTSNGYRSAFFDGLNRYYVAQEHALLEQALAAEPPPFDGVVQIRTLKPARENRSHPDHRLAQLFAGLDMIRLPLIEADTLMGMLTSGMPAAELHRIATPADVQAAHERLFGDLPLNPACDFPRTATIRDLYADLIASEPFRAACGRISASYAW